MTCTRAPHGCPRFQSLYSAPGLILSSICRDPAALQCADRAFKNGDGFEGSEMPKTTSKNDPVDVLIIGAGASGAAVAWSLADTRMHILCLEQGGWMNPSAYPSTGRDWEARFYGDYSPSPNIRARPEDYPINDDNS